MHFPARTSWHASRPLPLVLRLADGLRARLRQLVLVRPQAPRDPPSARPHVGAKLLRVSPAALLDILQQRAVLAPLLADLPPFVAARLGQVGLVLLQAASDAPAPGLN